MPEIVKGAELPELRVGVTRSVVVRYSGASTDFNEIHSPTATRAPSVCPASSRTACGRWGPA
jgi:hypothetical protein